MEKQFQAILAQYLQVSTQNMQLEVCKIFDLVIILVEVQAI